MQKVNERIVVQLRNPLVMTPCFVFYCMCQYLLPVEPGLRNKQKKTVYCIVVHSFGSIWSTVFKEVLGRYVFPSCEFATYFFLSLLSSSFYRRPVRRRLNFWFNFYGSCWLLIRSSRFFSVSNCCSRLSNHNG